jgi:DNA polymerase I-like protein with 3'-5' exonuclease and polymerase domains
MKSFYKYPLIRAFAHQLLRRHWYFIMNLITIDFETYYDKGFSLRKMTTESYIRDPRFEVIGVGVKVNNGATEWASGTHEELKDYLQSFDWSKTILLCHNTMFDGAILSWLFDVHPYLLADTLCIARALHGVEVGGSLAALAIRYGIGAKGTEVQDALGKRREDFTEEDLGTYGDYCINDVELTYKLFNIMGKDFPKQELRLIDCTLRMFVDPVLELDLPLLKQHLKDTKQEKEDLITSSGVTKKELMSNPQFAELLRAVGVTPPTKTSLTTGKETLAFAKTDEQFQALLEHEDPRVQLLVSSRLGVKGSLEESRTQRFISIAKRGLMPVPIRYYAAHTGRWGGDDKINIQNLPSRGVNGKKLKSSMLAPKGYTLVDCDSSQIEARVLAWLAEQEELVSAFAAKKDVYITMAATIYGVPEDKVAKTSAL